MTLIHINQNTPRIRLTILACHTPNKRAKGADGWDGVQQKPLFNFVTTTQILVGHVSGVSSLSPDRVPHKIILFARVEFHSFWIWWCWVLLAGFHKAETLLILLFNSEPTKSLTHSLSSSHADIFAYDCLASVLPAWSHPPPTMLFKLIC